MFSLSFATPLTVLSPLCVSIFRAYIEFFVSASDYEKLQTRIKSYPSLSYHAANAKGDFYPPLPVTQTKQPETKKSDADAKAATTAAPAPVLASPAVAAVVAASKPVTAGSPTFAQQYALSPSQAAAQRVYLLI